MPPRCRALRPEWRVLRLVRCVALGVLAATVLRGPESWKPPAFSTRGAPLGGRHWVQHGTTAGLVARRAQSGKKDPEVVVPLVDDSDFTLEDEPTTKKPGSGKKSEDLESLLRAADAFATKKDRAKRSKKTSTALSLENDLKGLTLEDDEDMSAMMMSRARTGKVEVSLQGRLARWAQETKELIQNPTPIQLTYSSVFFSSVAILAAVGLLTFALGAVSFKGDDQTNQKRLAILYNDPALKRAQKEVEFKRKAMEIEDIRLLTQPGYKLPEPPALPYLTPESAPAPEALLEVPPPPGK